MKILLIISVFISLNSFAQVEDKFMSDFLLEDELKAGNQFKKYQTADFSELWTTTENYKVLGIIGAKHQRIRIALTSIEQNPKNHLEYDVVGKSKVKENVCDFKGTIVIDSVMEVKSLQYVLDQTYMDSSVVTQGIAFATYKFEESKDQMHSGVFSGKLQTKWYTNSFGDIKYDDIQLHSDSYMNNAFIGSWTLYNSQKSKICNWADYRVPYAAEDFDIGAGAFSPSEKYYEFGWEEYQKAWLFKDEKAMENELAVWWD